MRTSTALSNTYANGGAENVLAAVVNMFDVLARALSGKSAQNRMST